MRAIQMVAPGETNVLLVADIPRPDLINASDVLVRVHAAGVNPIDAKIRKLNMYYPGRLPTTLGCDGAGTVEAVGRSVTRFRTGDEVFFSTTVWVAKQAAMLSTRLCRKIVWRGNQKRFPW